MSEKRTNSTLDGWITKRPRGPPEDRPVAAVDPISPEVVVPVQGVALSQHPQVPAAQVVAAVTHLLVAAVQRGAHVELPVEALLAEANAVGGEASGAAPVYPPARWELVNGKRRCLWEHEDDRVCGKLANTKQNIEQHWRTHTGEKPFACDRHADGTLCGAAFGQAGHLKTHIATVHDGRRDHVCDHFNADGTSCDQAFGEAGGLKKHIATVHDGRRDHVCDRVNIDGSVCGQAFGQVGSLKTHTATVHEGRRDHVCGRMNIDGSVCGGAFGQARDLRQHIAAVHDGRRDHICDRVNIDGSVCGVASGRAHDLRQHIATVHDGRRDHICDRVNIDGSVCGAAFGQAGHLKMHIRTHDPGHKLRVRKEEERLDALLFTRMGLKRWTTHDRPPPPGYVFKEFQVAYTQTTPHTGRASFRLDYLIGVPGGVVILECDEHHHTLYPVFDDAMRMLDVEAELDARGCLSGSKKLWIRYNPNRCMIGNATRAAPIPRAERERWLRDVLTRLALTPDFPPLVLYAFYPAPSTTSVLPKVAFHSDFPNELLDRVRSHVQPHAPPECLAPWMSALPALPPPADPDAAPDSDSGSESESSEDESDGEP